MCVWSVVKAKYVDFRVRRLDEYYPGQLKLEQTFRFMLDDRLLFAALQ